MSLLTVQKVSAVSFIVREGGQEHYFTSIGSAIIWIQMKLGEKEIDAPSRVVMKAPWLPQELGEEGGSIRSKFTFDSVGPSVEDKIKEPYVSDKD